MQFESEINHDNSARHLTKRALRKHFRAQRNALSPAQQLQAGWRAARQLRQSPAFRRARRIGFYLAADGEVDTAQSIIVTLDCGKHPFLPCIPPMPFGRRMRFGDACSALHANRYGIPEPQPTHSAYALDLLIVPLVAFDDDGYRLGMGGGFYDRTLQPPLVQSTIGLAHRCQYSPQRLPREPWDRPLDAIIIV